MYVVSYYWSGIRDVITISIILLGNKMAIYKKYNTKSSIFGIVHYYIELVCLQ